MLNPAVIPTPESGAQIGRVARARSPLRKSDDPLLSRVKVKGVVDWLDLQVELARSTNFMKVQRVAERNLGEKCFVKTLDPSAGGASRSFSIRIHDVEHRSTIDEFVAVLNSEFGLTGPYAIPAIEISLDFWGTGLTPDDERALILRLMGSLYAERLPKRNCGQSRHTAVLLVAGERIDPTKTLYAGNESDSHFWRAYWKGTDRKTTLERNQQRARVEVCVKQPVAAGLLTVDARSGVFGFLGFAPFFRFRKLRSLDDPRYRERSSIVVQAFRDQVTRRGVQAVYPTKKSRRKTSPHTVADSLMTRLVAEALRSLERRFNAEIHEKIGATLPRETVTSESKTQSHQRLRLGSNSESTGDVVPNLITSNYIETSNYIDLPVAATRNGSSLGRTYAPLHKRSTWMASLRSKKSANRCGVRSDVYVGPLSASLQYSVGRNHAATESFIASGKTEPTSIGPSNEWS